MDSTGGLGNPWASCPMADNPNISSPEGDPKPGCRPEEIVSEPCVAPPESDGEVIQLPPKYSYYDEHFDIRR